MTMASTLVYPWGFFFTRLSLNLDIDILIHFTIKSVVCGLINKNCLKTGPTNPPPPPPFPVMIRIITL